ncbi:hypothetical protein [Rhizobium sp. SSA_523]|uniref:hypothetical protein n=1 Tax=Rhizobium sp. SSA_523 TaxID=2952477 RepID=UPI0020911330|nr:hypothetical protein [Rhizobium sp. SSA_523]MCO5730829.1 hypothetical protein [Rhizobium sp. SSA_523]WKC24349.1 hypothetical protein QTJ18_09805 [Rhizobium sp. SSA_523]
MRHLLIAASVTFSLAPALFTGSALAQSPGLEQACVAVAKTFLLTPVLKTGVVQSFPELTPPGARLTYSTRENPEATDFQDTIECEFKQSQAPFGLTRFCISNTCYAPNEDDPERQRRFAEVKALMDRQK